jgi:hypothetical protein
MTALIRRHHIAAVLAGTALTMTGVGVLAGTAAAEPTVPGPDGPGQVCVLAIHDDPSGSDRPGVPARPPRGLPPLDAPGTVIISPAVPVPPGESVRIPGAPGESIQTEVVPCPDMPELDGPRVVIISPDRPGEPHVRIERAPAVPAHPEPTGSSGN